MDLGGGMMAKISFPELDAYISKLSKLYKDTEPIVKAAVYEGAGILFSAAGA